MKPLKKMGGKQADMEVKGGEVEDKEEGNILRDCQAGI